MRQKKSLLFDTPVSWEWAVTKGKAEERDRLAMFDYMLGFVWKLCWSVAVPLQRTNLREIAPSASHARVDTVYSENHNPITPTLSRNFTIPYVIPETPCTAATQTGTPQYLTTDTPPRGELTGRTAVYRYASQF